MGLEAPGDTTRDENSKGGFTLCIMLFAGGRYLSSCHELSDHTLSLSSCQATTCSCGLTYFMFKGLI